MAQSYLRWHDPRRSEIVCNSSTHSLVCTQGAVDSGPQHVIGAIETSIGLGRSLYRGIQLLKKDTLTTMKNGKLRDAGPDNTASGSVIVEGNTLTLHDVDIAEAPDAIVLLTHHFEREGALQLGPLVDFQGTHQYEIPNDADVNTYDSVTVWCEEYSVPMGFADLTEEEPTKKVGEKREGE